jgi:Zn-dependent peptidase ImmA (M78 family)
VRYIRDTTGRFDQRPHYEMRELDEECDYIITSFMQEQHGRLLLPIPTDDLTKLIERDTDDLDLYSDLSDEGPDVEGVTYFPLGQKPLVRIANGLLENRLRTTLSHEYGHVKFHNHCWQGVKKPTLDLFSEKASISVQKCQRAKIIQAAASDWMEWQAGYICSAILMPAGPLRRLVQTYFERYSFYGPLPASKDAARELITQVISQFAVSRDAARVRLIKMGYITEQEVTPSLFG